MTTPSDDDRLGRRELLQRGVLAGLGLSALPLRAWAQPAGRVQARVQRYATLGRTGMRVSDISFGGSRLGANEVDSVRHALDRGINYFDTADSYRGGDSETTIGEALRGKRDRVYIASKTYVGPTDRRDSMMRSLEQSLRRLRTDYVDVYFNHAVNDVGRLQNPEWREFTARAKQQGKIRFVGMSGHAGRLIECLDYAARHRRRRRDPGRPQLRPGPHLLPAVHAHVRLRRAPAGPAARAAEGESQGRRRGRHEDADGSAPQRHAALRARAAPPSPRRRFAGCSRTRTWTRSSSP